MDMKKLIIKIWQSKIFLDFWPWFSRGWKIAQVGRSRMDAFEHLISGLKILGQMSWTLFSFCCRGARKLRAMPLKLQRFKIWGTNFRREVKLSMVPMTLYARIGVTPTIRPLSTFTHHLKNTGYIFLQSFDVMLIIFTIQGPHCGKNKLLGNRW